MGRNSTRTRFVSFRGTGGAAVLAVALLGVGCSRNDLPLTFGVTPQEHVQFPIVDGTPHELGRVAADGPIACSSCHGGTAAFTEFSCVSCHEHRREGRDADGSEGMDLLHRSIVGYGYDSNLCYSCHKDGRAAEIARSEHEEYFPIDTGSAHEIMRCDECHVQPGNRTVVSCTSCHRDTDGDGRNDHDNSPMLDVHGSQMAAYGYAWNTESCLTCHERSENPGRLEHPSFPVAQGAVHEGYTCADCHASRADRADITCITCHEQKDDGTGTGPRDVHGELRMFELHAEGAVPGYEFASRTCYSCHKDSQVPGELDHSTFFPIDAASVHALGTAIDSPAVVVECTSCHQSPRYAEVTCTTCHAHEQPLMDTAHTGFPGYTYASSSCIFCHLGGKKAFDHSQVPGVGGGFPVSSPGDTHRLDDTATAVIDGLVCADCHASQTNRSQMRCTSCHDGTHDQLTELARHGAELTRFGYQWDSAACVSCHQRSQVPGVIDHEPAFPLLPPSGKGSHETLACADCHADRERRVATLSCTACHQPTSAQDAREVHGEPRLGEVHNGFPEYVWSPASCIGCHADGTAASAAQSFNHVFFPIDTGNTHALASRGGTLNCVDCHATPGDYTRATINCLSCHQQVDDGNGAGLQDVHGAPRMGTIHTGVDGYLHDSPTCLECHPNGEPTGQFDHIQFPIAAGSAHQAVSCTQCHDPAAPKSDITALQCRQCHTATVNLAPTVQQIHQGLPGFVETSAACYGCHPNSERSPPFDHDGFFPIAAGTPHAVVSCDGCHTNPSSRPQVTCTGCHLDTNADGLFDHDVSAMLAAHGPDMSRMGYQWTTASCRTCHARSQVPGLLDHEASFPIASGTTHTGMACTDCHTSRQDRSQLACTSCHTQVNDGAGARDVHGEPRMLEKHQNGAVPGYAFDPASCYGCHQQAQVPGTMDHERFFPIGPGTFHELGATIDVPGVLVECNTCHTNPVDRTAVTCTGCHAHDQAVLDPVHAGFPDYLYDSDSCVFCHLGGTRQFNHAPVSPFPVSNVGDSHKLDNPLTPAIDGLLCSECHASQTNRTVLACTSCHQHTVAQADLDHGTEMASFGYRYDSGACYQCHQTSQTPGLFDHEPIYPLLPPSGKNAHQVLSCADCHANRAARAASLACTTCHQPTSAGDAREVHGEPRLAEVHNGFPDYQWTPASCVGCHTDGTAASATTNINHVWFPIAAGQTHAQTATGGQLVCTDCHTTSGNFAAFDCTTCHLTTNDNDGKGARPTHGAARMGDRHAGVNGYVFASTECYACHPNSEPVGNFDHNRFPITTGTAHAGITCTECHTGNAPKTDVTALGCASCHATVNVAPETIPAIHNGVPGFVNASPSCYTCHPNAEPVGPMDHEAYFPTATGTVHASAAYMAKVTADKNQCSACHNSRTNRADELCAQCHAGVTPTPATTHTAVRGFTNTSPGCKQCHADATVFRLTQHPRRCQGPRREKCGNGSWTNHHGARCQNCHINQAACLADPACANDNSGGEVNPRAQLAMRTDKPWAIDFEKSGCIGCHEHTKSRMDNKHADVNGYTSYANPGCIACH